MSALKYLTAAVCLAGLGFILWIVLDTRKRYYRDYISLRVKRTGRNYTQKNPTPDNKDRD